MGSSYYTNESIYTTTDSVEMLAVGVIVIMLVVYLLMIGLVIADYVMFSMGLYKLANRRQIPNPWMGWLPYAREWLIGNLADDYDERNGIKRKWRVLLLALSLVAIVGVVIMYIVMFIGIFAIAFQSIDTEPPVATLIGYIVVLYIFLFIMIIIATTQSFCRAICIYKIFESTVPEKAVKYLLLYLLVPLGGSICLLKCQAKGYPYPQPKVIPCEEPKTEVVPCEMPEEENRE